MIKDRFLNWLAVFLCLIVSSGMLLKGLPFWWVGSLIAFLLIGFYLHEEDEDEHWLDDWEDYKATYEPPEEYNLPDDEHWTTTALSASKNWQAKTMKSSFCTKCNHEVYEVCMCNPVKKN